MLLLLILLGIIDFGRLLFVTQGVKSASREGARVAVLDGASADSVRAVVDNAVGSAVALGAGGEATTTITNGSFASGVFVDEANQGTGPCNTGSAVAVQVELSFRWLTPVGLLPGFNNPELQGTRPVSSTTTMRCE